MSDQSVGIFTARGAEDDVCHRRAPQPPISALHERYVCDAATGRVTFRAAPRAHFLDDHAWLAWNGRWAGREALTTARPEGHHAGRLTITGVTYRLRRSRVIWAMCHGQWPDLEVGHRNRRFDDDRIDNLRLQTASQHSAFARHPVGQTGHRGVILTDSGTFAAVLHHEGRSRYLGAFDKIDDAVAARNDAALHLHGDFARLSNAA